MRQFIIPTRYTNLIRGIFYEFPPDSREINESFLDIIFIHAFPFDSGMFKENFNDQELINKLNEFALKSGKIRIFIPDMPGFGLSESFNRPPDNLNHYVDVINDIKDYFKIENFIIGGCSMGGYICLEYANQYQKNLNGIILIDTKPKADTDIQKQSRLESVRKIKAIVDSYSSENRPKLKIDAVYLNSPEIKHYLDNLYSIIVSPILVQDNQEKSSKLLTLMKRQTLYGIMHALIAMAGRNDRTDTLKKFSKNILIVVGERDIITPVKIAKKMNKKAKNSELKIIPFAGHISNLDRPSIFNNIVFNWLYDNYK